jgi:hypothetical protein
LFKKDGFKREDICDLYYKRWGVEVNYRDEKNSLDIEKFHSKNSNGIRQELYSIAIMTIIARTISAIETDEKETKEKEPQLKNAIISLARDVAVFVANDISNAIEIFKQTVKYLKRNKYYKPKKKRKSYKRISKQIRNKWIGARTKRGKWS